MVLQQVHMFMVMTVWCQTFCWLHKLLLVSISLWILENLNLSFQTYTCVDLVDSSALSLSCTDMWDKSTLYSNCNNSLLKYLLIKGLGSSSVELFRARLLTKICLNFSCVPSSNSATVSGMGTIGENSRKLGTNTSCTWYSVWYINSVTLEILYYVSATSCESVGYELLLILLNLFRKFSKDLTQCIFQFYIIQPGKVIAYVQIRLNI